MSGLSLLAGSVATARSLSNDALPLSCASGLVSSPVKMVHRVKCTMHLKLRFSALGVALGEAHKVGEEYEPDFDIKCVVAEIEHPRFSIEHKLI